LARSDADDDPDRQDHHARTGRPGLDRRAWLRRRGEEPARRTGAAARPSAGATAGSRAFRPGTGQPVRRGAALLAALLALAGCGSVETQLGQVRQTSIGPVLVDGSGYTLYVHGEDPPGVSHCTPACTVYWPPVEAPPGAFAGGDFS